jgi:hypothetical protein
VTKENNNIDFPFLEAASLSFGKGNDVPMQVKIAHIQMSKVTSTHD